MDCFRQGHLPVGEDSVCQVDYLTVLTRKFQTDSCKMTFLWEGETAVRLGIKSGFGDMDSADSIFSLLSVSLSLSLSLSLFIYLFIYLFICLFAIFLGHSLDIWRFPG